MKRLEQNDAKTPEIEALIAMSVGHKFHYASISGGLALVDKELNRHKGGVDMGTFLDLRRRGFIDLVDTMRQGHPIFHGRVDMYAITAAGREYLQQNNGQKDTAPDSVPKKIGEITEDTEDKARGFGTQE